MYALSLGQGEGNTLPLVGQDRCKVPAIDVVSFLVFLCVWFVCLHARGASVASFHYRGPSLAVGPRWGGGIEQMPAAAVHPLSKLAGFSPARLAIDSLLLAAISAGATVACGPRQGRESCGV